MAERRIVLETHSDQFPHFIPPLPPQKSGRGCSLQPHCQRKSYIGWISINLFGRQNSNSDQKRKLKRFAGSLVSSYGVVKNMSLWHDYVRVVLDFHALGISTLISSLYIPLRHSLRMSRIPEPLTSKSGKNLTLSQLLGQRVVWEKNFPLLSHLRKSW